MRYFILVFLFVLTTSSVCSAEDLDGQIIGTINVRFEPQFVEGDLAACSLVYTAIQKDNAYLNGLLVAINGNLTFRNIKDKVVFSLKLGLKEVLGNHKFVRPNFAYLKTENYSTARVKAHIFDGDEGYRLYVYSLTDTSVMELFKEMIELQRVTIGFNRKKTGIDVLVPLDLRVVDTNVSDNQFERTRSDETMLKFTGCVGKLAKKN